jgi:heme oxygenase
MNGGSDPAAPATPRATAESRPLSLRLREDTQAAHESVERAASFNRLIVVRLPEGVPNPSAAERARHARAVEDYREVYRRFLIAAYGFEEAANRRLGEPAARAIAERTGFAPEPGEPTALIRDDLARAFGPGATETLGTMDGLAPVRTIADLVGVEYVRRGSRMGGAVIGAIVRCNLGFGPGTGASFLGQYGSRTRQVVADFKRWVDALALPDPECRRAVQAAIATFGAVERWHLLLEQRFDHA